MDGLDVVAEEMRLDGDPAWQEHNPWHTSPYNPSVGSPIRNSEAYRATVNAAEEARTAAYEAAYARARKNPALLGLIGRIAAEKTPAGKQRVYAEAPKRFQDTPRIVKVLEEAVYPLTLYGVASKPSGAAAPETDGPSGDRQAANDHVGAETLAG